jgi:hypothetical protein
MSKPRKPRSAKHGARLEFSVEAPDEATGDALIDAFARDMEHAVARIGGRSVPGRAEWLVERFLPADPATLTSGDVLNRRQELVGLVFASMMDSNPTLTTSRLLSTELPDAAALRKVWTRIKERVDEWAAGKPVKMPATETVVVRRDDAGRDLRAKYTRSVQDIGTAAVFATFDLLTHPDVRVRLCDVCNNLFIPVRRQERHATCARKVRDSKRPERGRKPRKGGQ